MTKTEYTAAIEADLTAANALCAELRTLRNFKKIAQTIPDADKMVSFETLDKTITGKEAELQKLRSALDKNRRIVKKLEEIVPSRRARPTPPSPRRTPPRTSPPEARPRVRSLPERRAAPRPLRARRTTPRRSSPRLSSPPLK